ncbi:SIT4 phosphatase-associated protein-domain-containing protein [Roridomyces roridus]|uniref:SIT4 phosphatase-associated protein-domain-containing protein n=1 Tax=Roridomyces roridus TaxID=1738132 RepID=A0AAD7FR16_9AGAR|nr:SIT4 phosphatase-associated protein-domain-containing protein [Roridomyces roridus]
MFWRFGFHNASAIDSLLDKEDVSVESILDEDDLLQECKAQNTRLIDYFQRVDVLQRLLAYVTGQMDGEERGQFKYPYVATEVLCSEIWSIVETCVNSHTELLVPFWDTVLERSPDDMKTQMVMAAHFAKINAVFLSKKPADMLAFIRAQPDIVARLLRHIETPSFVDLLVRIIQLDEQPGGAGVLEWLSSEHLMPRLIALLAPTYSADVHTVVAELIKGIISMATPAPTAGLAELHTGPASNLFAREIARTDSVTTLASYILNDFSFPEAEEDDGERDTLPSRASCTSSVVNSIAILIELIRKNNSDYFEPYLFHTLRNRLIQVQQQLQLQAGDDDRAREALESALREMVEADGAQLDALQRYLRTPRSFNGPLRTTVGLITPLTFERYRICELLAELLHCSNMALLNRPPEFAHLYDGEGRLQGGLAALEELARAIALNAESEGTDRDRDRDSSSRTSPARELPVSSARSDSMSDPRTMRAGSEPPSPPHQEGALQDSPQLVSSSPKAISSSSPIPIEITSVQSDAAASTGSLRSHSSKRSSRRMTQASAGAPLPIGEMLKRRFVDLNIAATLLDLFFEFPWNNFLHSSVYDFIHQILTGNVDGGLGRELAVSLFRDARLMHRIVEGQRMNDVECVKPKSVRLGFMGHLTLIAEDVLTALDRFPEELRTVLATYAPQPDWDDYVAGRYRETKRRDAELLGGGKPVVRLGAPSGGAAKWKVDEEDTGTPALSEASTTAVSAATTTTNGAAAGRGEFKRAVSSRPVRENSADFGPAPMEEEEDDERVPAFEYEMSRTMQYESDEDDDDGGGWLSQSSFSLGNPPVSSRHMQNSERRPLGTSGFDDVFDPSALAGRMAEDPFSSPDDDGFGPFSDAASADGSDPFTFSSSFSDEMEDTAFDSFADFGEFSTSPPRDGELTPTAGSWTFTSGSSPSASDDAGSEHSASWEPQSPEEEKRMP